MLFEKTDVYQQQRFPKAGPEFWKQQANAMTGVTLPSELQSGDSDPYFSALQGWGQFFYKMLFDKTTKKLEVKNMPKQ